MADIELVIKIPKYVYNTIVANDGYIADCDNEKVGMAIINGTPLPKGHGRLIDVDELEGHRQIQIVPCGNGEYAEIMTYYQNDIDIAHTIIEADKAESEDKE